MAKDTANAIRANEALIHRPVGAGRQAAAHLALARLQQEAGAILAAFDHACFAAVRKEASGTVRGEAKALAQALARELANDQSIPAVQRKAYQAYAGQL